MGLDVLRSQRRPNHISHVLGANRLRLLERRASVLRALGLDHPREDQDAPLSGRFWRQSKHHTGAWEVDDSNEDDEADRLSVRSSGSLYKASGDCIPFGKDKRTGATLYGCGFGDRISSPPLNLYTPTPERAGQHEAFPQQGVPSPAGFHEAAAAPLPHAAAEDGQLLRADSRLVVPSSVAHERASVAKLLGVIHSEEVSTGALQEHVLDHVAGSGQPRESFSPPALFGTQPTGPRGMTFLETVSVVDNSTLSAMTDLFGRQVSSGNTPAPPTLQWHSSLLSPVRESFLANPFMDSPNVVRIPASQPSRPIKEESAPPAAFSS